MVGFALAHSGAIIPLGLSTLLAFLWLPTAIIWIIVLMLMGARPSRAEWAQVAALAAPLMILHLVPINT